jgi:hypothetical protein
MGRHLSKFHPCNSVRGKARIGDYLAVTGDKCIDWKGNRIPKANCCVRDYRAIKSSREAR